MCKITKSLRAILDPDNPEDKKILLLAELIEDMRDTIYQREDKMQEDLTQVMDKVESVSGLIQNQEEIKSDLQQVKEKVDGMIAKTASCPIIKNTSGSKFLNFVAEYPKVTVIILLMAGLLLGVTGQDIAEFVIKIISHAF